jgi:ribosomal protein L9
MSKRGKFKKNKSRKAKHWTTAVDAAQAALKKTGSLSKARIALRMQAAQNARKLFGSI